MSEKRSQQSTVVPDTHQPPLKGPWKFLAWLTTWLLLVYLVIVLPIDRVFPAVDRWFVTPLLLIALGFGVLSVLTRAAFRGTNARERTLNVMLLGGSLLMCALMIDVSFTAYSNYNTAFRVDQKSILETRLNDEELWSRELLPLKYQPTDINFELFKPGQVKRATVYGEHYYPALLKFPIIRDSVLRAVDIEFDTDKYGLRNSAGADSAALFALGDSFCLGYHVSQDATFTARLGARLGEPVYNMGVDNSSPMQQVLLFEYLLKTYPTVFRPKQLVWMIFEGNDLEDDYRTVNAPHADDRSLKKIFDGTIVGTLIDFPSLLRRQSVLRLLTGQQLSLNGRLSRNTKQNHFQLDGQTIAYPLYHSAQFGYRLFRQVYLDRATQSDSYVRNHPNLPALTKAFERMQKLATDHKFEVLVVIAPSDVRLYRHAFEDFPAIADQPYFIDYLKELSAKFHFAQLDLNEGLAPDASREMLYHRDDTHWNDRGNDRVADLVAAFLAKAKK